MSHLIKYLPIVVQYIFLKRKGINVSWHIYFFKPWLNHTFFYKTNNINCWIVTATNSLVLKDYIIIKKHFKISKIWDHSTQRCGLRCGVSTISKNAFCRLKSRRFFALFFARIGLTWPLARYSLDVEFCDNLYIPYIFMIMDNFV